MKKSNIISNLDMNNQFTSSKNSPKVNSHYKKEINLVETLKKAKEKDQGSILTLINKYYPLVDKYSNIYKLKNYEKSDLNQEGNIAILNAINKFDLSKNLNAFDGYTINSIRNKFGTLARIHIKRNTESSLNILGNDEELVEIIDLIEDPINIEENYIKSDESSRIHSALNTLSKEELTLIDAIYLTKSHSLLKYCKENNLTYHITRRKLKKSLEKLKTYLQ
ncbi:sigma-70 family RNA polymerase sigma factor [Clostridium sp. NSJ-145]|uniref:sigma-70 family RNA polymerase sigma factor n=1 Tax=Clostridium sp. NSJ-145 TaxID=2897777 RepID=UPI001E607703|nr:sigma-70 family RNA polymerase sigma factor [Clostridium sp. NSJ-145]MCD2502297.1 sigma-70 family RNA polymerase sigma factor [Clostridium sp. NSJ-145]